MANLPPDLAGLPGEEYMGEGLADIAAGRESVSALFVELAAERLRFAGVDLPVIPPHPIAPQLRLYRKLGQMPEIADPYSYYNALLRRVLSLCSAVEHRRRVQ